MRACVVLLSALSIAATVVAQEREPNETMARADRIQKSLLTIQGALSSASDVDWFCLDGQEGYLTTFVVTHAAEVDFDFAVYSDSNCMATAAGPISGDLVTCRTLGRCFIKVWSRNGSGPYKIEIKPEKEKTAAEEAAVRKKAEEEAARKQAEVERMISEADRKAAETTFAGRWYYAGWRDDPGGGNSRDKSGDDWVISHDGGKWSVAPRGRIVFDQVQVEGKQIRFREVQSQDIIFAHELTLSDDGQKLEGGFTYYFQGASVQTRSGQYYYRRQQ